MAKRSRLDEGCPLDLPDSLFHELDLMNISTESDAEEAQKQRDQALKVNLFVTFEFLKSMFACDVCKQTSKRNPVKLTQVTVVRQIPRI